MPQSAWDFLTPVSEEKKAGSAWDYLTPVGDKKESGSAWDHLSPVEYKPESPKPKATPKPAAQQEYYHPLNANAVLQEFGLSAAPPAQKPRIPILDTRKTSFGVGLGSSLGGTVREIRNLAAVGDPAAQARAAIARFVPDTEERAARAIEPSPDEVDEATRTIGGKIAYGAGFMGGELPKYATATGAARGVATSLPGLAARPMVTTAAADVLGTAAVDISRDPNALTTEEGRRQFAANQLGNLLQSPLSRFGAMTRAASGAGIGAATEWATGGDASDIAAGAILQGGMAGSPMGRADAPPLRISDAMGPLSRLGDSFSKRMADPQYQADQQRARQILGEEGEAPKPPEPPVVDVTPEPNPVAPRVGETPQEPKLEVGSPEFMRLRRELEAEGESAWADMSADEMEALLDSELNRDQNILESAFGAEGAKRFKQLERIADSRTRSWEETHKASDELSDMLDRLTPEQREDLEGTGLRFYPDPNLLQEYSQKYRSIEGAESPDELAFNIHWALTRLGDETDPLKMNSDERLAYAQIKRAMEVAVDRGFDVSEVNRLALQKSAYRFSDPADAEFMLGRFLNRVRQNQGEPPVGDRAQIEAPSRIEVLSIEDVDDAPLVTNDVPASAVDEAVASKQEDPAVQADPELAEADAMIRAAESGQVMSANPLDLGWAYLKKTEHAINQKGESANAWLRANVFPERGETLRTAWLDARSALSNLDRVLHTPFGEGAHAIAQTNANLLHKVQLTAKEMIGAVTKKTATVDALPQAKRIKEIDAELDHYYRWKLEKEELESKRDKLASERDGLETNPDADAQYERNDGDTRLAEIDAEIKSIEQELAKNKEAFEFSGSGRDEDGTPTKTVDDVMREREDLFSQLSPDQQKAVADYSETLTKGYHALMDRMVEGGLISKEKGEEYKQDKSYLPLYREIEALRTSDTDSTPYFKGADGIRINPLLKERNKGGSTLAIADPTKNFILYTAKALKAIQDNELALYVADQRDRPEIQGLIRKVNPGIQHKLGKEEGTFWARRDGKLEQYVTSKELADAIQYSPKSQVNILMDILAYQGRVLRSTATGMNLGFGPGAFVRDMGSALVHQGIWNPFSYMRAAVDVIGQTQNFKDFVMDGASMSGYFGSLRGIEKFADQLERPNTAGAAVLNTLNIRKVRSKADFVKMMGDWTLAPLEGASKFNEILENVPRQAVYNRRRGRGDDGRKAAYAARNATVDFQKMGRDMQVFNMVIPFINARAQSLENLRSTGFRKPATVAGRIIGAGLMPAVSAVLWNMTQYPDVYDQVPPEVKDKSLVVIFGRARDPITNEFTQVIEIPKTEALAPIMNLAERWLVSVRSKQPIEIDKMATQTLSDISPISFAKGGEVSGLTAASAVIPPGAKAGLELALNKNFHTERDIDTRKMVDQGWKPEDRYIEGDTPLPAIYAGQFLGASPRKIENFVGTTTAGVGRQAMQLGDLALRALTGQPGVGRSASKLAKMYTGGLTGVRADDPFRQEREGIRDATEAVGQDKADATHAAERMIQSVIELPMQEQFPALQKAMQQVRAMPQYKDRPDEVKRVADELLDQYTVVFHRNAERVAHSIFAPVANLPEAERIPLLVQEMEKQKVPDKVKEYVADLNRGGKIVTPMTEGYFKRNPTEVRAEYVVDVMKTIPTGPERAAEWDRLVKLGVISPKVKAIFGKKWREATQPAQGSPQP